MTPQERDNLKQKAMAATPGPWETRCREFSNTAPTEIWTEPYGWLDQLPFKKFREPTYEYIAAANPAAILELISEIERLEEIEWKYNDLCK